MSLLEDIGKRKGYFLHQYQRSLLLFGMLTYFVQMTKEPPLAVSVFAGVHT